MLNVLKRLFIVKLHFFLLIFIAVLDAEFNSNFFRSSFRI